MDEVLTPHRKNLTMLRTKHKSLGAELIIRYNISIEMFRAHSAYVKRRVAYRVQWGKFERNRPLERPRRRWEGNIKMDVREVGWGMDWIDVAQNRDRWRALVYEVMNFWVPQNGGISRVAKDLSASQAGLRSMELVS
jgi:hypothetical protein